MRILTATDYYLPGFRGGTLRALANIVDRMAPRHEFWIVTGDRDAGERTPYDRVDVGRWHSVGDAQVYYTRRARPALGELTDIVRHVRPDLLLLFGVFSSLSIRLLLLRRVGALPRVPVLLAPAGELTPGALAQKWLKKAIFLRVAFLLRFYDDVHWKATSAAELEDIRSWVGSSARMHLSPEMPPRALPEAAAPPQKTAGSARLLFLSRVSPVKNLHFLLEQLRGLNGHIALDVVGPADEDYLRMCRRIAGTLDASVTVAFLGEVPHEQVMAEYAARHYFVLPSLGESFGYAILEALAAGRPVLISDATPWTGLDRAGAGWTLPLSDPAAWRAALQQCIDDGPAEYAARSAAARGAAVAAAGSRTRGDIEDAFATACARTIGV